MINFKLELLDPAHVEVISRAFAALGWPGKDAGLYRRYLAEQDDGTRTALVALDGTAVLGYLTVLWRSGYLPFREAGIPEICDLNVLPQFRRHHVGTALMDAAESLVAARSATVGLGVGLYADYGPAHLMYLKRGYVPDGRGIAYEFLTVAPGTQVRVDDNLTLMMTRELSGVAAGTDAEEHRLVGGNVSDVVVRVGETVRKPGLPQTPAVEAFLSYLNAAGYSGAPRTLGRDERGRHVLEYVPGRLAHDMPAMDLEGLYRVGTLIRELHDIAEGFAAPPDAQWDVCIAPDRTDLICHLDLAPWNLVCDGDLWVFIDWDGAGPGSRLWDLAWAAAGFVAMDPGGDPAKDAPRLAALGDGYGLTDQQRREFPPLIGARSRGMADLLAGSSVTGKLPWARLYAEGHADFWGPAADYAERNVETWTRALR